MALVEDGSPKVAGLNAGNLHTKVLDLTRQGLGKNRARRLGGAVETGARGTEVRKDRTKVGEDTGLLRAENGQNGATDGQLAQNVGVELRERLLAGNFLAAAGEHVARGIDDDVDAARDVLGVRDNAGDGFGEDGVRRGHVEGLGHAGLGVRGEDLGDAGGVAGGGEDDVALAEGATGDLTAEAGGGAGDEPDLGSGGGGGGGGGHFDDFCFGGKV